MTLKINLTSMAWSEDDVEDELGPDGAPGPDESDQVDDPAEVPCPYCKREIHDDAVQCPYCGCYLSREDAPPGRPWWWIVAVLLVVLLLLGYVLRR
jgi:hypothetical protein